jgi:hypothetical protein
VSEQAVSPFISQGIDERVRDAVNDRLPLEMLSVLVRTAIDELASRGAATATATAAAAAAAAAAGGAHGEGHGGHGGGNEAFDARELLERWTNMTSRLALESVHTSAQRAASDLQTAIRHVSATVAANAVSPSVTSGLLLHFTSLAILHFPRLQSYYFCTITLTLTLTPPYLHGPCCLLQAVRMCVNPESADPSAIVESAAYNVRRSIGLCVCGSASLTPLSPPAEAAAAAAAPHSPGAQSQSQWLASLSSNYAPGSTTVPGPGTGTGTNHDLATHRLHALIRGVAHGCGLGKAVDGQGSALGQHVHSPLGGRAVVRILEGAVACTDADGTCK